jgi:hypothetical protein
LPVLPLFSATHLGTDTCQWISTVQLY